jgi:hypothetical protein
MNQICEGNETARAVDVVAQGHTAELAKSERKYMPAVHNESVEVLRVQPNVLVPACAAAAAAACQGVCTQGCAGLVICISAPCRKHKHKYIWLGADVLLGPLA